MRWARLKVDDLLAAHDAYRGTIDDKVELRAAVVATALEHGLVTRFTSRVAVELAPSVDATGETRDVKSGLPKGSQLMGSLPQGGTLDDAWRILGLTLVLTGAALLHIHRRRFPR